MASLMSQKTAAAINWIILDNKSTSESFENHGLAIDRGGEREVLNYATYLFSSDDGIAKYYGKSDDEILKSIYYKLYSRPADQLVIDGCLSSGKTVPEISAIMVSELLSYNGTDKNIVEEQDFFESEINKIVFTWDGISDTGSGALDISSIYYILGDKPESTVIKAWGVKLNKKEITFESAIEHFLVLKPELNNGTDIYFVNEVFGNALGREPSATEKDIYLAKLASGESKISIISELINDLKNMNVPADNENYNEYIYTVTGHKPGEMPTGSYQEKMVATYLALPQRDIDAEALVYYSRILEKGKSYQDLMGFLLGTKEFQNKGAALDGVDYLKHVFSAMVTNEININYEKLWVSFEGKSKAYIVDSLLNEFRYLGGGSSELILGVLNNPTTYYTAAANFEEKIGSILNYKTVASLSTGDKDYNVVGTVNTGLEHVLSYAELAILKSIDLYINNEIKIDMTTANNLIELNVYGDVFSEFISNASNTVQFINRITLHNANVTSSVNGNYYISQEVDMSHSKAILGLKNNVNVFWDGNAINGGANHVGDDFIYSGRGILSANLITKTISSVNENGVITNTITSNLGNFPYVALPVDVSKVDLGGYIGKTEAIRYIKNSDGTVSQEILHTEDHTFDYGIIESPSYEGLIADVWKNDVPYFQGNTHNAAYISFALSKKADNVHVLEYGTSYVPGVLSVIGDATASSHVTFHLTQESIMFTSLDINFIAVGDNDVDAGKITYLSSPPSHFPQDSYDQILNVSSKGEGRGANHIIIENNEKIGTVNITGDRAIYIGFEGPFSDLRNIILSGSVGNNVNLDSSKIAINGNEYENIFKVLKSHTNLNNLANSGLSDKVLKIESINNYTDAGRYYKLAGNTFLDQKLSTTDSQFVVEIKSSNINSGIIINNFNSSIYKIIDNTAGMIFSNSKHGLQISDYGTLELTKDGIAENIDVGYALSSKVGVLGYENNDISGGGKYINKISYIIVDNNENYVLDKDDTLFMLIGENSHEVHSGLYYEPNVEINGKSLMENSELSIA